MTTITVPAEIRHLDWPTPPNSCEHDHDDGYCTQPATWRVTIAFVALDYRVVQHYCERHAVGLASHLALCVGCSGLYRIVGMGRCG